MPNTGSAAVDAFLASASLAEMRANIGLNAIGNAESFGYADGLFARLSAGRLSGPSLALAGVANTPLLSGTGYSLTGSNAQSAIDIAGTWNTSGTPTLIKANVTDTASNAASLLMDLQVGGVSKVFARKDGLLAPSALSIAGTSGLDSWTKISYDSNGWRIKSYSQDVVFISGQILGVRLQSAAGLQWSSTTDPQNNPDLTLLRDAANTLALRNSTNAQTLNIYGTYTSGSVYERLSIDFNSSLFRISTQHVGASNRGLWLDSNSDLFLDAANRIFFDINGARAWAISTASCLYPVITQSTSQTTGFINISGAAGVPSGVPGTTTGFPMYYDSTNNRIYVYNGSWRSTAALT